MVDADSYFGEYLRGEDVKENLVVTIESVKPETVGEQEEEKLVVYFKELKKALVLNKTNKDRLKEQLGSTETDNWLGKQVTLTTEPVAFKGETKPAIRILQETAEGQEQPPEPTKQETLEKPE